MFAAPPDFAARPEDQAVHAQRLKARLVRIEFLKMDSESGAELLLDFNDGTHLRIPVRLGESRQHVAALLQEKGYDLLFGVPKVASIRIVSGDIEPWNVQQDTLRRMQP
jgi:hypothetical protein